MRSLAPDCKRGIYASARPAVAAALRSVNSPRASLGNAAAAIMAALSVERARGREMDRIRQAQLARRRAQPGIARDAARDDERPCRRSIPPPQPHAAAIHRSRFVETMPADRALLAASRCATRPADGCGCVANSSLRVCDLRRHDRAPAIQRSTAVFSPLKLKSSVLPFILASVKRNRARDFRRARADRSPARPDIRSPAAWRLCRTPRPPRRRGSCPAAGSENLSQTSNKCVCPPLTTSASAGVSPLASSSIARHGCALRCDSRAISGSLRAKRRATWRR